VPIGPRPGTPAMWLESGSLRDTGGTATKCGDLGPLDRLDIFMLIDSRRKMERWLNGVHSLSCTSVYIMYISIHDNEVTKSSHDK